MLVAAVGLLVVPLHAFVHPPKLDYEMTTLPNGLRVVGENPGPPGEGTGGDELSDDLAGQLEHAPRYAEQCGLEIFFWAFEDNLFDPASGVSVGDLGKRFAQ